LQEVFGEGKTNRKGRAEAKSLMDPTSLPPSIFQAGNETSGYLPSEVTWMRNGWGGSCDESQAKTKESIYYPVRKFVLWIL
jgi:hypothetical protein